MATKFCARSLPVREGDVNFRTLIIEADCDSFLRYRSYRTSGRQANSNPWWQQYLPENVGRDAVIEDFLTDEQTELRFWE